MRFLASLGELRGASFQSGLRLSCDSVMSDYGLQRVTSGSAGYLDCTYFGAYLADQDKN